MYIHEQHNVLPKGGKSVTRTTTPYIARCQTRWDVTSGGHE